MTATPFIIDCDTGRDDALALWVALSRGMNLAAVIASYGNVPLDHVIENTARVLGLAGRGDIPLLAGAAQPGRDHSGYQKTVLPRQAISGNGLCNLEFPEGTIMRPTPQGPEGLAAQIIRLAEKHGKIDYVILGPATNFAQIAAALGPRLTDYIGRVTMLGGRMESLWDQTPVADFNIICDPFAVRDILDRKIRLRFITLNTTWPIALTLEQLEGLIADNALAQRAKELMIAHTRHFAPEPVFRFHDPAVMLAMDQDDCFEDVFMQIDCDEASPTFGRLMVEKDGKAAQIHRATSETQNEILNDLLAALDLRRVAG